MRVPVAPVLVHSFLKYKEVESVHIQRLHGKFKKERCCVHISTDYSLHM